MSDGVYFHPQGLLCGKAAHAAVEAGHAVPLAGGPIAFTLVRLIEGAPGASQDTLFSISDLLRSTEPVVGDWLEIATMPCAPVAGLSLERPRVMGVVNVTPDSFSDGGLYEETEAAIAHGGRLVEKGADIVDIGGESTRPGAEPLEVAEELSRVLPVIEELTRSPAPLSIDTRNAIVMKAAIRSGAQIINDVSALSHDPDSLATAAESGMPVVLMHAQGDPRTMQDNPVYDDVLLEVYDTLKGRIDAAMEAGVTRHNIIADPGIGFGKTLEHNLALLDGLALFHGLGVPLLVGASRKRFIGALADEPKAKKRVPGSLAAALAAAARGVQILRVHDVRETVQALTVYRAIAEQSD